MVDGSAEIALKPVLEEDRELSHDLRQFLVFIVHHFSVLATARYSALNRAISVGKKFFPFTQE